MSDILIFDVSGNILASFKERNCFKIGDATCEANVEPTGCLTLCKYIESDTRKESYIISCKAIKEEFYRRNSDLNLIKEDINSLMIKITQGDENVEELSSEMTRMLLLKGQHQKRIAEIQKQINISVTYKKIRKSRISVLSPGMFIKLSWLPKPIMWCHVIEEKEETKVHLVTEQRCIPPLPNIHIKRGHIYVAGGKQNDTARLSSLERYDIERNDWVSLATMKHKRALAGMASLNGKLYIAGGTNTSYYRETMEQYDPVENKWTEMKSMSSKRSAFGMVAEGGHLYAVGGFTGQKTPVNTGERFEPNKKLWEEIAPMNCKRANHSLVALNGYLYAIGGRDSNRSALSLVEKYCPEEDTWTMAQSMNFKRHNCGAAALNGKLYVIGGFNNTYLKSLECYDPYHNKWSILKPMNTPRFAPTTAAIDNKLYAIGGYLSKTFLSSVETYDPTTNKWIKNASMNTKRVFAASSVIAI